MSPSDIQSLILLVVLLLLSAFFSSSETALTTVNKIRMRTLAESGDKRAETVLKVTDDSPKMLSAILIGNNLVNISASSLATTVALRLFGNAGAGIATGVLTLLILIFGEVSPKSMASLKADSMSLKIAGIIRVLMIVLTPVIFIINHLSLGFIRILGVNPKDAENVMTEEELRTIVDVSQETGVIEHEERDMIHKLFDFGDAEVKGLMVPRIDMTMVSADAGYDELMAIYRRDKYTRFPVFEGDSDHVIGTINMKDVFLIKDHSAFSIRKILREPYYIYEHKNTADLFMEMRQARISIAIVLDEYGETAGMVTLEDLLEEIVGEIRDEYDTDETDDITPVGNGEYLLRASANLEDVSRELNLNFVSEDYDTIGGYCLGLLDHLPREKETILTENGILIRIEHMDRHRITQLYLKLPESEEPDTKAEAES